jgi:hypothetical protein
MTGSDGELVRETLNHRQPPAVPADHGSTFVTGIHVSCVAALRRYYGLGDEPVRVIDPGQMLGFVDEDLKRAMGVCTEGVFRRMTRPGSRWKAGRNGGWTTGWWCSCLAGSRRHATTTAIRCCTRRET